MESSTRFKTKKKSWPPVERQALAQVDTWTRAHGETVGESLVNRHNAGPADKGPQVMTESERHV